MKQTYISAVCGSVVADYVMRGYKGSKTAPKFGDVLLSGLQGGSYYVAYPIACEILRRHSEHFRHHYEDKDGSKALVYIEGGALAAGLVVAYNYPISILQKKLSGQKAGVSTKELVSKYIDQVGSSIGFTATMKFAES